MFSSIVDYRDDFYKIVFYKNALSSLSITFVCKVPRI